MSVQKQQTKEEAIELIENTRINIPSPSERHRQIRADLVYQILDYVAANGFGEVRFAPFKLYLNEENIYQPDILFAASQNQDLLKEDGCFGTPDVVIEVVENQKQKQEQLIKKSVYERYGLEEYWIIDLIDNTLKGYRLEERYFTEVQHPEDILTSDILEVDFKIKWE